MHELGVMLEVVKTVEDFARKNQVSQIDTLVLQIGELSSIIPKYVESCYPAAVNGTLLHDTNLKIEIIPGNAICNSCNQVFNLIKNDNRCQNCESEEWGLLSGKEFLIKEIVAY